MSRHELPQADRTAAGGGERLFAIVAFVTSLGFGFFVTQCARKPDTASSSPPIVQGEREAVPLRGDEPSFGPRDALVTIVEFADYQCPSCARAEGPLRGAIETFEGDVRLVFKHMPMPKHDHAIPAARAAWAAHQQGKFWELHERLFAEGGSLERLPAIAAEIGIDVAQLERDIAMRAALAVDEDFKAGATLRIAATPTFFVNGHRYIGVRTAEDWRAIIAAEREEARMLVRRGVPRAEIHEHIVSRAEGTKT